MPYALCPRSSNLIRVVFMGQSNACSYISNVVGIIEVAVDQAVKQVASHMLTSLNAMFSSAPSPSSCGSGLRWYRNTY